MLGTDGSTGKPLAGIRHLRQSVRDILTTPLGSRVMRRTYGSELFDLIDQPLNALTRLRIIAATAGALLRWEPRIKVQKVEVTAVSAGSISLTLTGIYTPSGQSIRLDGIQI